MVKKNMSENLIKFKPETIKMSEVMELSKLTSDFITQSKVLDTIKESDWFQGDSKDFIKMFERVPEAVFSSEESTKSFLKIFEFCTGIDVDNDNTVKAVEVCKSVLKFLEEVDILSFLQKVTMTFTSLTRG